MVWDNLQLFSLFLTFELLFPIIDAAKSLKNNKPDQFKKNEKKTISLLKKIRPQNISINNKFKKYFAPKTITELKKIIKKNRDAEFLSGGTDMSLIVTKQKKDIKNIKIKYGKVYRYIEEVFVNNKSNKSYINKWF